MSRNHQDIAVVQPDVALQVTGVSIEYQRRGGDVLKVLEDISLEVPHGQFVSILGPSGCGKSTFLRAIDGLVPIAEGVIRTHSKEVHKPGPDRAFVFQAHSLLPWQTAAQNAAFGLRMRGMGSREAGGKVQSLLELVGLAGFEDSYPRELSGGMQQRVNLARALALDPDILLMDEPFAALDAQTRVVMQRELLRIWSARERKSVVFVTHNVEEAVFLSDRVIVLSRKPARVRGDIAIDIPRPRDLDVTTGEPFRNYVAEVWDLIEPYVFEETNKS